MATRRTRRSSPDRPARNPGGSPAEIPHAIERTHPDEEGDVSWGDERFNEEEADKEARRRARQLPSPTQRRKPRPKA